MNKVYFVEQYKRGEYKGKSCDYHEKAKAEQRMSDLEKYHPEYDYKLIERVAND